MKLINPAATIPAARRLRQDKVRVLVKLLSQTIALDLTLTQAAPGIIITRVIPTILAIVQTRVPLITQVVLRIQVPLKKQAVLITSIQLKNSLTLM